MSSDPIKSPVARVHEGSPAPTDAASAAATDDVLELAKRLGCRRTLQVGGSDLRLAAGLAQMHSGLGSGRHDVVARDDDEAEFARTAWSEHLNGGSAHAILLGGPCEATIVALLTEETAPDLVVIEGAPCFEQAFVEFVLIDRQLAPGATVVLMAPQASSTRALMEFIDRGRAYERRSPANAATAVLRKLGRQQSGAELVPSWPDGSRTAEGSAASLWPVTLVDDPSARLRHVQRLLVDAEQRAAEVVRLDREVVRLEAELGVRRAAHEQSEFWLTHLQTTVSWRVTSPLRWVAARLRR